MNCKSPKCVVYRKFLAENKKIIWQQINDTLQAVNENIAEKEASAWLAYDRLNMCYPEDE